MRLKIEKLVYGGAGLARADQGVIFVPRSAPGDVVEVEIVGRKKDYSTARIIEILQRSPDRQEPYCPNYESAGCCHWQHIRYDRQLDYKEAILRETFRRIGHFDWNGTIHRLTGPDRNYRLRATFHVTNGRLGFMRENTNTVVAIRECASLVTELNQFIGSADAGAAGAAREVHAVSAPEVVASFVLNDGTIQRSGRATIQVGEIHYRLTADTFFQANRFLLSAMINEVLEQAGPSPGNVLELYAGVGFFSIPLARIAKEVIAIESNRMAVRLSQENSRMNQAWQLRAVEGQVDATLHSPDLRPNVVVLDPPRSGCGEQTAAQIAALRPDRIVYVSCNPATFAREAATFKAKGYELGRVALVDQFPNTFHIELVASFEVR
jgi:23S rRNA (uracil1939-C5)-methyltransferase